MYYIKGIQKSCLKWYVYAALAVHLYFKSYTGPRLRMGKRAIISVSQEQKLNTKISTEVELVGVDEVSSLERTETLS